jgi:hypothetical protein
MSTPHRLTQADIATIVRRRTAGGGYPEIAEGLSAHEDQARKANDSHMVHLQLPAKVIQKHRLIKGQISLAILDIVKNNPFIQFQQIANELKQHDPPFETIPHGTSIQRYLAREGWHPKDTPRVAPISSNNRMKRLVFAENHAEDDDFWDHVVWSDEMRLQLKRALATEN